MAKKNPKHLFTKNGIGVTSYKTLDSVFTLADYNPTPSAGQINEITPTFLFQLEKTPKNIINRLKTEVNTLKQMKIRLIPTVWLSSTAALTALVVILVATGSPTQKIKTPKYSIFSSKPPTMSSTSTRLFGGKTEAATLDAIFESYKCPLAGMGKTFVKEAQANDIPFWVAAAISFQESNCGRKTPKLEGVEETYNAWGWGVWGDNLRTFESWEDGIKRISKYLGDGFYAQGITDPCEIMKIYTPPSDGSWCEGVKYFGEIIYSYETPAD